MILRPTSGGDPFSLPSGPDDPLAIDPAEGGCNLGAVGVGAPATEPPPFVPSQAPGAAPANASPLAAPLSAPRVPEPRPRSAAEALAGQTALLVASQPWQGKVDDEARRIVVRLLWDAGKGNVAGVVNAPPKEAQAALDAALARANPALPAADRAKLRDAVLGNLASYKVALPWVSPAGGDALARLPKDLQEFAATRMRPDTLDPWRRGDFEKAYLATNHRPVPAAAAERNAAYATWYYDEVMTPFQRMSLSCMHAKLKAEGLTDLVGPLSYVAPNGILLFSPTGGQPALKQSLEQRGYGDWWMASHGNPWGVRDHERGVQLHFRGNADDLKVNVHIDFHNPGDPPDGESSALLELPGAAVHLKEDLIDWDRNHVPDAVLENLERSGIKVPRPAEG